MGFRYCMKITKKNSEDVLVNLRNCLLELGINDDDNFDIEMLRDKVTNRTQNNLDNVTIEKLNQYDDFLPL